MAKKREKKPNTWDPNYNKSNKKSKLESNENKVETNNNEIIIGNNSSSGNGNDAYITTAGDKKIDSKNFWNNIQPKSEIFEQYYKAMGIIDNEEEFKKMFELMGKPLPTTFRINTTIGKSLQSLVIDQLKELVNESSGYKDIEIDGELVELPSPFSWYPNEMAWKSSIPKKSFKKNPELSKFHHFLVHHNQQGNITRQEAVSMIPPLFLDVQSHYNILDMCAAPGSKTTQILEDLHMKHNLENEEIIKRSLKVDGGDSGSSNEKPSIYIPKGCIIANDVDTNRCYMLVTQTTRLGSPAIIVTNHEAQNFPLLYSKNSDGSESPIYMDRILCDVPCSGDGTTRKNPEVWKKWTHAGSIGLHQLQIKIATRGCQLLKVGGRMVYSTCSMNPVENEAVIAQIIQKSGGSIKLVDVSSQYPSLIRRPGLHSWTVIDKAGNFPTFESQPEDKKYKLSKTLWPPTPQEAIDMHLEYCMRVYPHLQDTGGFFIAVLEKVSDCPNQIGKKTGPLNQIDNDQTIITTTATTTATETATTTDNNTTTTTDEKTTETTIENQANKQIKNDRQPKLKERDKRQKFFEEPFTVPSEELKKELDVVSKFYGLIEFPMDNLLTRGKNSQKIYWASDSVLSIISNESNNSLKVINCALKLFQRHDGLGAMECAYRISQDSVLWIEPFLSKRIVTMTHDDLVMIFKKNEPFFTDFNESICDQLKAMEPGCFVIKISGALRETLSSGMAFSAWRGKVSMHLLVSKQEIQSYKGIFHVIDDPVSPTNNNAIESVKKDESKEVSSEIVQDQSKEQKDQN
ncbi:hypothetical protein ACTFIR_000573 [Dictyostelium discoideum]